MRSKTESPSLSENAIPSYRIANSASFQESQAKGSKNQDDTDVYDESLPEPIPKEQYIDTDDNGYQNHDANGDEYRPCHCLKPYHPDPDKSLNEVIRWMEDVRTLYTI
ncbi:MAG: hypothetical protein JWO84_516 [Parcubacteria group bacterium]|nr:hypothetical protein [Parcubacteria group bacterium]